LSNIVVLICVLSGMQINTPESVCGQLGGVRLKLTCLGVIFYRELNYCQQIFQVRSSWDRAFSWPLQRVFR
jgi:hypothetical protein